MELRQYQIPMMRGLERLVGRGEPKICNGAPTGSGKTVIASAIMHGSVRRALVVAHRREIVNQTSAKLTAFDVHHGIIQAGDENKLRPLARVQVASIQTLHARAIRAETMLMPLADDVRRRCSGGGNAASRKNPPTGRSDRKARSRVPENSAARRGWLARLRCGVLADDRGACQDAAADPG